MKSYRSSFSSLAGGGEGTFCRVQGSLVQAGVKMQGGEVTGCLAGSLGVSGSNWSLQEAKDHTASGWGSRQVAGVCGGRILGSVFPLYIKLGALWIRACTCWSCFLNGVLVQMSDHVTWKH